MNKEDVYSAWAPEQCVWSKWVKPVLFAYITDTTRVLGDNEPEEWGNSVPAASSDTRMVIDLDGPPRRLLGQAIGLPFGGLFEGSRNSNHGGRIGDARARI